MSKKSNQFTEEEKAAIALKAASGGEEAIKKLADEHNISVAEIRNWIQEKNISSTEGDTDEYSLNVTDDFSKSVEFGATFDKLNYKRLTFWSVFGIAVILIMIVALMALHNYTTSSVSYQVSERSQFFNIEQIERDTQNRLNSFGVVDPEEGIYHVPVDTAISMMVNEFE